jgi:hypothetical protein
MAGCHEHGNATSGILNSREFFDWLKNGAFQEVLCPRELVLDCCITIYGDLVLKNKGTRTVRKSYGPVNLFKFNYFCFLSDDMCGNLLMLSCFISSRDRERIRLSEQSGIRY